MLKRKIDFDKRLVCVQYGRMSSDEQNPRSPDQQFDEIQLTIQRQKRTWTVIKSYRDDGISGRYLRKRLGFQKMLRDIRTGIIQVDAILVDTWERIGRADELAMLRYELWTKYGVLILTANTQFSDPTSEIGKVVGMFEQVRATSSNEVKAHEVFRGKRDVVLKKRWPGGPPPFGKRLRKCIEMVGGKELVYSLLDHDLESEPVVIKLLNLARETGWGQSRLARGLNADPDVPEKFKPINEHTVGYILDNPIYVGELLWAEYSTGVVDDTRVLQKNPESEMIRIPDFCEAIYPREDWDAIQSVRRERSNRLKAAIARGQEGKDDAKQLQAPAPGMVLNYLLTGLVFCSECNSRMAPCSSIGANRHGKRLSYYRCPLYVSGGCKNGHYIREDKLRASVIARLRSHLFPPPSCENGAGATPPWLTDLIAKINQELQARSSQEPDPRPGLQHQLQQLQGQLGGWMQSLGKPDLPIGLRQNIEAQYTATTDQIGQLQQKLLELESRSATVEQVLDADAAMERLHRLDQVLGAGNLTAGNLELSLHIDRIDVSIDGSVTMRTSKLGLFEGAVQLLAGPQVQLPASTGTELVHRVKSRRRAKLRVDYGDSQPHDPIDTAQAADAGRFGGLDAAWFWEEPLEISGPSYWSAQNAQRVAAKQTEDPNHWTQAKLAEHFAVSIPTIRKALRLAEAPPPSSGAA